MIGSVRTWASLAHWQGARTHARTPRLAAPHHARTPHRARVHVIILGPSLARRRAELLCWCAPPPRAIPARSAQPHATPHLPPSLQLQLQFPLQLRIPPGSLYIYCWVADLSLVVVDGARSIGQGNARSQQIERHLTACQEHNRGSSCPTRPMDQQPTTDMEKKDASLSALQRSLSAVTYCCGACGYDLRLRSSDRNTAGIVGGGYGRAARRGVVPFDAIDDARFGHADEFRCVDVRARRLFVRRTRLLCRKCGASLGFAYDDRARADDASAGSGRSPRYDIKIRALQPLAADDDAASPSPPAPSEGA